MSLTFLLYQLSKPSGRPPARTRLNSCILTQNCQHFHLKLPAFSPVLVQAGVCQRIGNTANPLLSTIDILQSVILISHLYFTDRADFASWQVGAVPCLEFRESPWGVFGLGMGCGHCNFTAPLAKKYKNNHF